MKGPSHRIFMPDYMFHPAVLLFHLYRAGYHRQFRHQGFGVMP